MTEDRRFLVQRGTTAFAHPRVSAGFEHRDQIVRDKEGNVISSRLVVRHMNIQFPQPPPLPAIHAIAGEHCIKKYKKALDAWMINYKNDIEFFELVCEYDKARIKYVYRHRNDDIPDKYRTGEDVPETIMGLLKEITKLKIKR